jgi:hypothetical protein
MRSVVWAGLCLAFCHVTYGDASCAFAHAPALKSCRMPLNLRREDSTSNFQRRNPPSNLVGRTRMLGNDENMGISDFKDGISKDWMLRTARSVLPSAACAILALSFPLSAPAELSPPQKLIAQTWATVDATFVDRTFNNNDWFQIRQTLIKRRYTCHGELQAFCIDLTLTGYGAACIIAAIHPWKRRIKPFPRRCSSLSAISTLASYRPQSTRR